MSRSPSRLRRNISFAEDIQYYETYSNEEYDRKPEEDLSKKEEELEEVIDNLDIHVIDVPVADLLALKLVDFHKMLELLEDDGEPVCDFGVFLVQEESEVGELRTGDLVISVGEEECLESTAAQLRNTISRLDSRAKVTMTVGRRTQQ